MTKYLLGIDSVSIAPNFDSVTVDKVPSGYYRVALSMQGYYLAKIDPLEVASKVYGSLLKHLPRIETAFAESPNKSISVMLDGLKGSGKSLLMKTLAKRFVENEDGIVITVNEAFYDDAFFSFLQDITQKKIVLMDEFDKVYSEKEKRNRMLTLLDGNFASHTMYILTMNAGIGSGNFEFFHNRPGRIMFNINFVGVPEDTIDGYLQDVLEDKNKIADVKLFARRFTDINMDMLSKLVAEVNAYPDLTLEQISEYLNVKPDLSMDDIYFTCTYVRDGVDVTKVIHGDCDNQNAIKRFLKQAGTNYGENTNLNLMLSGKVFLDTKTQQVVQPPFDSEEGKVFHMRRMSGEILHGAQIKTGPKQNTFVAAFDEYVSSQDATQKQDPKTGIVTITVDADEGSKWVITLKPEVKRYQRYIF